MDNLRYLQHLIRDFLILIGGIVVAILLVKLGAIDTFLAATSGLAILTSFFGGMFFTSVLTIAPASVALAAASNALPSWIVALLGALGAAALDYVLFRFFRYDIERDVEGLLKPALRRRILSLFHFGFLKWMIVFIGASIIASPLPDELGLVFLTISRVKHTYLFPILFVLHFVGILVLVTAVSVVL